MRSLLPLVVALTGCMVYPGGAYYRPAGAVGAPAPVPVQAPRLLSEGEAVSVAGQYAASQGLQVDYVKHATLDGAGRWHVDMRGRGHDRAKVLIDARSGRVLDAKLKAGKHGHGHDRDDDDRDD